MTDALPTSLAHFRIERRLGAGGMGVVYRAVDEELRRTVALKVLPSEYTGNEERRARFLREARSAAAVTHANLATVYEIGEHGRKAEAVAALHTAPERCDVLDYPFERTRSVLALGEALEASGDRAAACAAYGRVVDRWGKTKPASVTAQRAEARRKALGGCKP